MEELLSAQYVSLNHVWTVDSPILEVNPPYNITPAFTHEATAGLGFPGGLTAATTSMVFSGQHGAPTIDAIGHIGVNGVLYGGVLAADVETGPNGVLSSLDISEYPVDKYVTRGVLIDMPYCLDMDMLPANYTITDQDIMDCAEKENGVEIGEGDSVLIRTGWGSLFESDPATYVTWFPGGGLEAAEYLASKKIFLTGMDNLGWDLINLGSFGGHLTLIAGKGIYIVENMNLDDISSACQDNDTWEFALVMNPPQIKGAAAMAANSFAIFHLPAVDAQDVSLNHVWTVDSPILGLNSPYDIMPWVTHEETASLGYPGGLTAAATTMMFSGQHGAPTIDAIGHIGVNGVLYGGVLAADVETGPNGVLSSLDISEYPVDKYVTRGVLIDMAYCLDMDMLPANYTITDQDIMSCAEKENSVEIGEGDSVLIRTGWGTLFEGDPEQYVGWFPGGGLEAVEYLVSKNIFLTGMDNLGWDQVSLNSLIGHQHLIAENGIYIVENMNLDLLSSACQDNDTWEFALVMNPPQIKGAAAMAANSFAMFMPDDGNDVGDGDGEDGESSDGSANGFSVLAGLGVMTAAVLAR